MTMKNRSHSTSEHTSREQAVQARSGGQGTGAGELAARFNAGPAGAALATLQARVDGSLQAQQLRAVAGVIQARNGTRLAIDKGKAAPVAHQLQVRQPGLRSPTRQQANARQLKAAVLQREFDKTVAALHPLSGTPVEMTLFNKETGLYIYNEGRAGATFFFKPDDNTYFNEKQEAIVAPPSFNEDAPPAKQVAGASNTFRDLTFTVDGKNRVVEAKGKIHKSGTVAESGRSSDSQQSAWEHVQGVHRSMFMPSKEFNGGHIIAHHFGGSPGTDNMVPMEEYYNQSGGYKTFENNLDGKLKTESPLNIKISVKYEDDYASLMGHLVKQDLGNKQDEIDKDPAIKSIIMRTLARIPVSIKVDSLTNSVGGSVGIADPSSPIDPLQGTIRSNYKIRNIGQEEFSKEGREKDFKPYVKDFGPNKGKKVGTGKDTQSDYLSLYAGMPRPGILSFTSGAHGLAGGVEAYVWIDPMGVYNRFGGSDTIDTVDPLGSNWPYFRKAIEPVKGADKQYKRGHLLNADLHGPGADSRNLLAITTAANNDMSRNFEEPVKKSEALINPKKGVLWKTIAGGGDVARPFGWDKVAAGLKNSEKLFDEEAKLPKYIDCYAWEGIIVEGTVKKGRQFLKHRVWNKHPGDNDGELGIRYAGKDANDTGINNKKAKAGDNNVTGHTLITLPDNQEAYKRGYSEDAEWLNSHLQHQSAFFDGLHASAYDTGFAARDAKDVSNWPEGPARIYKEGYAKGARRAAYTHGFYDENYQAPGNDERGARYRDGRYERGKTMGRNLATPAPVPQDKGDPVGDGYRDGMRERGEKDAEGNLKPASDNKDYVQGYWHAYGEQAERHGYDCAPFPQALPDFDKGEYLQRYLDGQQRRGDRDGYRLRPPQQNQSKRYEQGYFSGMRSHGKSDGYHGRKPQTDNKIYLEGFEAGATERSEDDGYNLDRPTYNLDSSEIAKRAYHRGAYDRGRDEGRRAMLPLHNAPESYKAGHRDALRQRGADDGYALRQPLQNAPDTYLTAYRHGAFRRGARDGQGLRPRARYATNSYDSGYQKGLESAGNRDGYRTRAMRSNNARYLLGFARGRYRRGAQDARLQLRRPRSEDHYYLRGFQGLRFRE